MKKVLAALILSAMLTSSAGATHWHVMGPRAMGMGGAGVAVAQGPLASYWNPAGLGQLYNTSGLLFPFGARFAFTGGLLQGANDLFKISQDCQTGTGSSCGAVNITAALDRLDQPGSGALLDIGGGGSLKIKRIVVFVNNIGYIGVQPLTIDRTNTGTAGGATGIENNTSSIQIAGVNLTELGVGYGRELGETGLILGANIKGIVGKTGYNSLTVAAEDAEDGGFSDFDKNAETTIRPSFDVGLLWDVRETFPGVPMRPRFGITGRNLNDPKFDFKNSADKYHLNGQVRGGIALSPFKFWHLAADLDLTNNLTPVEGFHSRFLSLGTEINVINHPAFNIPLRVGLQKNVAKQSTEAWAVTGGFGVNLLHLVIDVAGMVSSKQTTIESEGESAKIPNNFGGSVHVGFMFGGKDEGVRNK